MKIAELIAEARRLGESSPGDGWRRLLWQMADHLERLAGCIGRFDVEDPDSLTPEEAAEIRGQWQADWDQAAKDAADLHNLRMQLASKVHPAAIRDARGFARDGKRIARSVKSGRQAVMNPKPLDWGEGLELVNAVESLAWSVEWLANELEKREAIR